MDISETWVSIGRVENFRHISGDAVTTRFDVFVTSVWVYERAVRDPRALSSTESTSANSLVGRSPAPVRNASIRRTSEMNSVGLTGFTR